MVFVEKTKEVDDHSEELTKSFKRDDPFVVNWLWKPHTVAVLLIASGLAIYLAYERDQHREIYTFQSNVKFGIGAALCAYFLFCATQMKDGLFVRPHPIFWRLIMGVSVLYMCILVFLLFQNVDDARKLLSYIDPALGKPLPERSYAEKCELYTPNDPVSYFRHLYDTVNDEFIIAHLLGWFGKALLLRDYWMCWIGSVSFELLELSLEHYLPNFAECWWDHIILDIFVCNWLGIALGIRVVNYFQMKEYNWIGKRVAPDVDRYEWGVLLNWRRFLAFFVLTTIISMVELNAFFLKYVLWIPPPHPINVCRLVLWWSIGMPGVREYYAWITNPEIKKFGPMAWMCAALNVVEFLVWFKFGKGMFPKPTPPGVLYGWSIGLGALAIWAIWYYGFYKRSQSSKKTPKKTN